MQVPSMRDLLEAGVHFGHQIKKWNPKMSRYIFTARNGVHVLDLAKTVDELDKACEFVKNLAAEDGKIVFLGTKKQARQIVKEEAARSGALFLTERWIGGFLTNFEVVSKSIEQLTKLKEEKEKGEHKNLTKKEQLLIDRKIAKLERLYGGLEGLNKLPDAIFIIDCKHEDSAVREANKKGVPIVAICDTNSDPNMIDYPIPGNDDALKAIQILTGTIADAYLEGRKGVPKSQSVNESNDEEKPVTTEHTVKKTDNTERERHKTMITRKPATTDSVVKKSKNTETKHKRKVKSKALNAKTPKIGAKKKTKK